MRPALVVVAALVLAAGAHAQNPPALQLGGPQVVNYARSATLRGRVTPAQPGAVVTILRDGTPAGSATAGADGRFAFRIRADRPARYEARLGELVSNPVAPMVRPRLVARIAGQPLVRRPLRVVARVQPADAGVLRVVVRRGGRITYSGAFRGALRVGLRTRKPGSFRIRVFLEPAAGYRTRWRSLRTAVVAPRLALGSRGPSVRAVEQRLRELGFALPRVDGLFALDTYQAVLAFQKVRGLPWTGRVDARTWRYLASASRPRARYRGNHVEVNKSRQVLHLVRGGRVVLTVHVSTGATGNTPVGRWRVYRKQVGWDWVLWYPMYFVGGFAIHGYPSVPAYPASHGCVRVPMWVAPRLHAAVRYGESVYVY